MKRVYLSFLVFVVLTVLILQFGFGPIIEKIVQKKIQSDLLLYYREMTRGVFHVMMEDLKTIEPSRWPDRIVAWQPHFGFPIAVRLMDASYFTPGELAELNQGLIILRGEGDIFFQRIGNSAFALQLGSFEDFDDIVASKIDGIFWSATIVFMSVLAFFWAFPFWLKIKRIRKAALAFGQGDLSMRARIPKHSALAPVSDAFNNMAERIEQLIDSQRELTRAVSHELRTPVARIRFHLEILAGGEATVERDRHIDGMQKDIDELDTLIAELMAYARYDVNPLQLSSDSYPLVPWLHEIAAYVEVELEGKRFMLHDRMNGVMLMARFNRHHMGRAVSNLLRNAAKYGCNRVELTVAQHDGQVVFYVDDDGPGIPEKDRLRIFEPFARLDDSRSRDSGGFGLGLAIVRRVVQWHNGTVTVSRSPLGGSRFTVQWPGVSEK